MHLGCVLCYICVAVGGGRFVAEEFGFDVPGDLIPGTPTSHEVWEAFFLSL